MSWLSALLLAAIPQADSTPFSMELPTGFSSFELIETADPALEVWAAKSQSSTHWYSITKADLLLPDAMPASIAEIATQRFISSQRTEENPNWPNQSEAHFERTVHQKSGLSWHGYESSWTDAKGQHTFIEQFAVENMRLYTIQIWGQDLNEAQTACASFQILPEWKAPPYILQDQDRGESGFKLRPYPARLRIGIDLNLTEDTHSVDIEIQLLDVTAEKVEWQPERFPRDAQGQSFITVLEQSEHAIRYEVPVEKLYDLGILSMGYTFAALDPTWLLLPDISAPAQTVWSPPSWELALHIPAHIGALSLEAPADVAVQEETASLLIRFAPTPAGLAWPAFLAGPYLLHEDSSRPLFVRKGARCHLIDENQSALNALGDATRLWMPEAPATWHTATFAGSGLRFLPGLLVLDEGDQWLATPIDALFQGFTRNTGLARMAAAQVFGTRLRGHGNGSAFLEHSLTEYAAFRLLQETQCDAEATAMKNAWQQNDSMAGELHLPLSLTPEDDLFAAARLLSRGPLVWLALEKEVGRPILDGVLADFVSKAKPWSCESLRLALEASTGRDLLPFFDSYLYGVQAP